MICERRDELVVRRFESLPGDRVDALVSTRAGGFSAPPYAGLNLGLHVGDDAGLVLRNRELLFSSYGLALDRSVWCGQMHGGRVAVVVADELGRGARTVAPDAADAFVTSLVDVPLVVTLADCVPVVLYDPVNHVAGLAHAGWGGTVRRIASATVAAMRERFGTSPRDLLAAIGPSIARDDYEVGERVISRARETFGAEVERLLRPRDAGKALFDLQEANALDLVQAGTPRARIEVAGVSPPRALDELYSHRAEGVTGRFAAVVALRG